MRTIVREAAHRSLRRILRWLAVVCVGLLPAAAQNPASTADGGTANAAAISVRGVLTLRGPWRFQVGDDPRWAEPGFDDSNWVTVTLDQPLSAQGIDSYSGYAWYRMRVDAKTLAALGNVAGAEPLEVLITPNAAGQLAAYVNGAEIGRTRGMTERPAEYLSLPIVAELSAPDASGARELAIRSWAAPDTAIRRGLLLKVEIGTAGEIADRLAAAKALEWDDQVIATIALAFLFLGVAGLGGALYLAQRHHSEYLWLAVLCVSVAANSAVYTAYGLAAIPLGVYYVLSVVGGRVFMAVTLEFVLRFTGSQWRRLVRIVQGAVLVLPVVLLTHMEILNQTLSVTAEVVFCGLICAMLFRAWRGGRGDAGTMLVPFFLAATAGSVDAILGFAAVSGWIPARFGNYRFYVGPVAFGTGTLAFAIFLASLAAVILHRFIRVSQEEQRSSAEIAAARSVQSLLIPTQLPSNKNFMLESAYLPVNGVGGDFFQVLPLADESLLLVVGDVSGKGLQAAMNSSTLVGALRNELSHDPATVLGHLNHVLLGAVSSPGAVPDLDCAPCFATCLCARIFADGAMTIANAGHLSPYRDGRELPLPPSLPLGVIADAEYEQATFQLNRGDRLVFLSDGVVEAKNAQGELFGFERTQQVSNEPARYIAQTAKHFGQTDDITVVSVYVASRAAQRANHEAVHAG
jgi:Stage II sporulation protein E (SpoIIE)